MLANQLCTFDLFKMVSFSFAGECLALDDSSLTKQGIELMGKLRLWQKRGPVTCDSDGVGSIPAISNAQNVPSLLCHELFNEASLLCQPGSSIC
jgi:hypothetical protein